MLPKVIVHNAVSVDGRIEGFMPDLGQFYGLIARWEEQATLVGSETLLAGADRLSAVESGGEAWAPATDDLRPLLVGVDSRGRIRFWPLLRAAGYWRDVLVLCSEATPADYLEYLRWIKVEYLVIGKKRVNLRAALKELYARGIKVVRVDSGGRLNGALLRANLVDEVSLLIHPALVGGTTPRTIFRARGAGSLEGAIGLKLTHMEEIEGGLVWLDYAVVKS